MVCAMLEHNREFLSPCLYTSRLSLFQRIHYFENKLHLELLQFMKTLTGALSNISNDSPNRCLTSNKTHFMTPRTGLF